jgi:NAD+ diphosphatase
MRRNLLSDPTLDRASHLRQDQDFLSQAWGTGRVLPLWRGQILIRGDEGAPRLGLISTDHPALPRKQPIFLGVVGDEAIFALDVGDDDDAPAGFAPDPFVELRAVGHLLPADEASYAAMARGLVLWHARHLFCGVCGHPTLFQEAGHRRVCTYEPCGTEHFPRSDPAVIVLVKNGDKILLARQTRWPEGMYSVLAGFVEPGESLEDAVAREVFEESGVRVTDVQYHSSQPWPFPSSLMLGFTATAITTELNFDGVELEQGGWFDRETLKNLPPGGPMRLPNPLSIARRLVDDWLAEG